MTLGPGDTATLTRARGNLHRMRSGPGARLVDVFAPPPVSCTHYALGEALGEGTYALLTGAR